MIALLYDQSTGQSRGVYPGYTEDTEILIPYVVVEELPLEILNLPVGKYPILNVENGALVGITYGDIPSAQTEPSPTERIAQLEAANTSLTQQVDDLTLLVADLIVGGGGA